MKVRIGILILSVVFICIFGVYQYFSYASGKLIVVFCNVGQGDAVYIRTPSKIDILVDSGPDTKVLECLGRHMPFWDKTIELAFATHPDADHVGGFVYLLDSYSIRSYNTSDALKETGLFKLLSEKLKKKGVPVKLLSAGDRFKIGSSLNMVNYWPSTEFLKIGDLDTNRYSLVQMLNFYNFNTLLTGDADFDIVEGVLESISKSNTSIEVFKLSHHGSKTGVSSQTFQKTKPSLGIISAGENNRYGHPHRQVVSELKKHKIKYLETKNGDIKITTDGNTWKVEQ